MADSYVCSGATMQCTMGTSKAKLTVLPDRVTDLTGKPQANISDHKSFVNLGPFGRCRSMGFPATASATAAAQGTLTPMPCMHNTPIPWMGGKMDYLIKGQPALLKSCKCQCLWGGTISLVNDGQTDAGPANLSKRSREQFPLRKAKKEDLDEEKNLHKISRSQSPLRKAKEETTDEETDNLLKKASSMLRKIIDSGTKLKDDALDELCDTIYKYGGDKTVEIMEDIAKGKYFGTEQWKYLLDQSYNLMENGYVEGNAFKKNAGSFLYLVCSAWQEDTWIDTFETLRAGDGIIDTIKNPNKLAKDIEKIKGKIKLLDVGAKTTKLANQLYNTYNVVSNGMTLFGKIKTDKDS